MGFFTKLSDSAGLVSGMANRVGVDLVDRLADSPELLGPAYRSMVMRCSKCAHQDACAQLQASSDRLDHAPDYCQNRDILDAARP